MTPRNLGVLAWLGVAAPIVYVAAVIVGGASIAGYDHVRDPISSLTEAGRTGVEGIRFLFLTYNLLVAAFGAWALATSPRGAWRYAFTLLILTAVCGLLMGPFAQDPIGHRPPLPAWFTSSWLPLNRCPQSSWLLTPSMRSGLAAGGG